MSVLNVTIWWWSSGSDALRNVEYSFIAITSRSTLTWSGYLSVPPTKQDSPLSLGFRGAGRLGISWDLVNAGQTRCNVNYANLCSVSQYICQVTLLVIDSLGLEVQCNVNLCLSFFATWNKCQAAKQRLWTWMHSTAWVIVLVKVHSIGQVDPFYHLLYLKPFNRV